MDIKDIIAQNVKALRMARGLNQYQLADALGVRQSTVGNIEAGIRSPSLPLLLRMAAYFGVTVDALSTPNELEPA